MSPSPKRVAILGGGMAGMTTAWRLSEPGWRDEFRSITVYQRGWRLGGKGASSRGPNGRIEEHGLHLWLGYYENAFRLLRECYAELDRAQTDPKARLITWRDAMIPTEAVGLEDARVDGWAHWVGRFSPNDQLPGEPDATAAGPSPTEMIRRALRLVADFLASLTPDDTSTADDPMTAATTLATGAPIVALAAVLEASARLQAARGSEPFAPVIEALDRVLRTVTPSLQSTAATDADVRRTWHLIAVMTATVRGVLADGLLTDPRGFRAVNDEDFLDWIIRHGADPSVADFAFIRGLYDLVFADRGTGRSRHGVSAGIAAFMTSKMFFEYKGAIFWKMAAGMGDVVFAPMYQALRARGVEFEFFHRVDQLHVGADGLTIDAITMGRQAATGDPGTAYDPLVRVGELPVFPDAPLVDQLATDPDIANHPLESHWCEWPDADTRVLRRGSDFDVVVFAMPVPVATLVGQELAAVNPAWRAMTAHLASTATQALQLWLRPSEPELGWSFPGATVSAYAHPFNTWASMDQLVPVETWPDDDRPRTIGYFCGALDAPNSPEAGPEFPRAHHERVRAHALRFIEQELGHWLPGVVGPDGPRWDLFCGTNGTTGANAVNTQFVRGERRPVRSLHPMRTGNRSVPTSRR